MVTMKTYSSREVWLRARTSCIGGSDAAAVMGMNPYKDNVTLWLEKTGQARAEDISNKPYVKYGTQAEDHLRELFRLDFPEYEVMYQPDNMWTNDRFPWAHASLDGWLVEHVTANNGIEVIQRKGILEIKTTNILQSRQKEKWNERIPDNYYIQLLHYLMVTEFDFAVLKAQLKFDYGGDIVLHTRHYRLERADVEEDIKILERSEKRFWGQVKERKRPALILPEI